MKKQKHKNRLYYFLTNSWYSLQWWNFLLLPFSFFYYAIISCRRLCYRLGVFKRHKFSVPNKFSVPIIIVGNITVGGTGKTPLVIYLIEQLRNHGFRPAVISRGYGRKTKYAKEVHVDSSVGEVGDEPLLIKLRTQCPVFVASRREKAIAAILKHTDANIIISDDGLQHYAMDRDIEIVVLDGLRRFGNGFLLPAGPLREPVGRLDQVDFVVNNGDDRVNEIMLSLAVDKLVHLKTGKPVSLQDFEGKQVNAIAGIGHPKRFFNTLISQGIKVIPHSFPDHYFYRASDLNFANDLPMLMTEKDRIKCMHCMTDNMYYLTVKVELSDSFMAQLLEKLVRLKAV
jgi:tetraacyldisaccharide 4'-kinase